MGIVDWIQDHKKIIVKGFIVTIVAGAVVVGLYAVGGIRYLVNSIWHRGFS